MADEFDADALAARYLDLWEKQLAAMSADPELVRTLAGMLGVAGVGLGGTAREHGGPDDRPHSGEAFAAASRAEATGAPSGDGDRGLEQLARRLADVEERLAALERHADAGSAGARRRSRKRSG